MVDEKRNAVAVRAERYVAVYVVLGVDERKALRRAVARIAHAPGSRFRGIRRHARTRDRLGPGERKLSGDYRAPFVLQLES